MWVGGGIYFAGGGGVLSPSNNIYVYSIKTTCPTIIIQYHHAFAAGRGGGVLSLSNIYVCSIKTSYPTIVIPYHHAFDAYETTSDTFNMPTSYQ